MNELIKVEGRSDVTMSSLELVEFINGQRKPEEAELRHADFLVKVPKVLGKDERNFSSIYFDSLNREKPCYRFLKREACLMAMSYSYDLQAKVFDRMTELEQKTANAPSLPDFTKPAVAARAWAEQYEAREVAVAQLEAAKPALDFVERYVDARTSQCITDVAKIIGWRPRAFTKQLEQDGVIFMRGVWLPYQEHINAGRFEVKTGENDGFGFRQTRVTPKGITWLAEKYGKDEMPEVSGAALKKPRSTSASKHN
ncbi:Phage antirepressor protein YoqD, KilAC domain [Nitrosospira sp. Nsp11]|uniref:phage antirepressor KilAC domain-containing protein n=1 Tax=Nitrosospira sp. Nsp11 TaxID=1855338 RepID=UPI0009244915|nr:phage antirepressor KilAC domain-containing protein [Nitrosospira sp. Nsp11]SHL43349.1 Phage antirepressor protein YoqD, KilAC domain [Nitrosospira sp. Nsp11]